MRSEKTMGKNKGLSLLDFFHLNQKTDYVSTELKSLFKNHGSLQRNVALHLSLIIFTLPKLFDELKPIKDYSRPFDLLINKIQELEKRIDLYISLMLESDIDLPSDIRCYTRLSDILLLIQPGKDKDDVASNLEKENKVLNHTLNIAQNKIKQLRKKQNFKMGYLTDSEIVETRL